jgi:TetR/AcrR family transcriptional repressor of cmeABC operon
MSPTPQARRKRATKQRILHHALLLFQEKGFENSSMNELVSRAKCSLETVYRYFDNKEDLFAAILDEWLERNLGRMDRYTADHEDLREGLIYISKIFINELFSDQDVQVRNMLMFDAVKRPELGQLYYNDFVCKGYEFVERYFRTQQEAGELRNDISVEAMSDYFTGMLITRYFFKRHFNVRKQMTPSEVNAFVKQVVDDFIKAFGSGARQEAGGPGRE